MTTPLNRIWIVPNSECPYYWGEGELEDAREFGEPVAYIREKMQPEGDVPQEEALRHIGDLIHALGQIIANKRHSLKNTPESNPFHVRLEASLELTIRQRKSLLLALEKIRGPI